MDRRPKAAEKGRSEKWEPVKGERVEKQRPAV